MSKVIVITGAGSGFGALAARALARSGHIVCAAMRNTTTRNAGRVAEAAAYAAGHGVDLRTAEPDVLSRESADAAISAAVTEAGRLDVLLHDAGHMVTGPTEMFTPEELAAVHDTDVLGTQRVNRAALPQLRSRRHGLVVWMGSTSTRGGTPPCPAPRFAAKSASSAKSSMDALAVSCAAESARFRIETTSGVPGSFTSVINHFVTGRRPADRSMVPDCEELCAGLMEQVSQRPAVPTPADADAAQVADAIVRLVDAEHGKRPRVHIDPGDDGSEAVSAVADRVRADFHGRIVLDDLLTPHAA
ncbi:SDR family NAD(P)-dependent oxidoreductase [Streptomyces sp. BE308]|uniref:SDR family NAD(P)-dependent oxidoreductase n=1 Tax=Streptomyces sp. BE308 TaxID=3002529 RepID=UPI002E795D06|nr:SDR family NAD(P)-dependent oxidoreductase [Streptomyces sp. BE308]MEE1796394.1 SDR family NAD(P)-dependent oxidoreductase [Streptomyces sp. BE308]